jgi:bile acid:Na+ symporter, BASS family
MTMQSAVSLALLISIWLIVVSLGLRASLHSLASVLRRPGALLAALAALFVATPAFAILLAWIAPLPAPIRFALVAMSVAPVAPILPYKQMKAGGDEEYAVGLVVAAALASLVATPVLVEIAARLLEAEASVSVRQVAKVLAISIALPLAAGLLLRALSERLARAISGWAQRAGSLLLLLTLIVLVVVLWRDIGALLGDGGALAIVGLLLAGLLAGHLLGGRDSSALALAAASRHPGVAIAIGAMSFPEARGPIAAAIVLFLVINALVTAPYVRWMGRRAAAKATASAADGPRLRPS